MDRPFVIPVVDASNWKAFDKSLYMLLQVGFTLNLFSTAAFSHATRCNTKLLGV